MDLGLAGIHQSARNQLARARAGLVEMANALPARVWIVDLVLAVAAGAACAAFAVHQLQMLEFTRLCRGVDLWFDADPARIIANLTDRYSPLHYRSALHPLWELFVAAPINALEAGAGFPMSRTAAVYVGLQAFCLTALMYVAFRTFRLGRIDALLGILLLLSTASGVYWMGFPESFGFCAASVVVCIIWLAAPKTFQNRFTGTAQNLISVSMLLTSWVFGVAAALLSGWPRLDWGKAFTQTRDALAILALLMLPTNLLFDEAGGLFDFWAETNSVGEVGVSPLQYAAAFFGHTLVAPDPSVLDGVKTEPWFTRIMMAQPQPVALTPLTLTIFGLWLALAGLSANAALRDPSQRPAYVLIVGGLGFFFVLHFVYGAEAFLFSIQFAVLMCFIALWGARSRFKWIVRGLCAALIAAGFAYNMPQYAEAAAIHNRIDASWLTNSGWVSDYTDQMACD